MHVPKPCSAQTTQFQNSHSTQINTTNSLPLFLGILSAELLLLVLWTVRQGVQKGPTRLERIKLAESTKLDAT